MTPPTVQCPECGAPAEVLRDHQGYPVKYRFVGPPDAGATMTFEQELEHVINRYSHENPSNTPDFILAQYLTACLLAWNTGVQQRETWYGRDATPGRIVGSGASGAAPEFGGDIRKACERVAFEMRMGTREAVAIDAGIREWHGEYLGPIEAGARPTPEPGAQP